MNKKALSVILSALMSVSVLQTPVFAMGEEPEADGQEVTEVQENQTTEEETEETQEPEEEDENLEEPVEVTEETPEVTEEPEETETPAVTEVPEETEEPEETEVPEVTEPEETEEPEEDPTESEELLDAEEESEEDVVLAETPEEEPEVTLITPEPVTYNGVTVTVSYLSDTFGGKEVTMVVGEPGETEREALEALGSSFKAVDITFIDEEGNPVQPEEGKNVSVSLAADGMDAAGYYEAVHVDGEGNIVSLTANADVADTFTEKVKIGEAVKTIEVPAETETVEVQDYKEETYTEFELKEQTVEIPAVISYRYVRKSREVEVTQNKWGFFNFGGSKQPQTRTEYYYEKEPYVVREAYTYSTWKRVPVQKTRTVPAGTHTETRVVTEAYSYEVTEDVYEDVTLYNVETSFSAESFSVYAIVAVGTDGSIDFDETFGADHITVNAPAGAFEEGTVMKIETVDDPDVLANALKALGDHTYSIYGIDISFWQGDQEVEPQKPVKVTWTSEYINAGDTVVHINDDGTAETVAAVVQDNKTVFTTDKFSTYTTTRLDSIDFTQSYANAIKFDPDTLVYTGTMASGLLADTHPEFDGYTYVNATYQKAGQQPSSDHVVYLGAFIYREFDDEGQQIGDDKTYVYYRTETTQDNDLIVKLADDETIYLHYEPTPLAITYNVEYNGTTYHMADESEVAALQAALGDDADQLVFSGPTSVKSNVTYTEAVEVEIPRGYSAQLRYGSTNQTPQLGVEPSYSINNEHKIISRNGNPLDLDYKYDIRTSTAQTVTLTLTKRTSFTFDASYFLRTVYTGGYYNNQDANYGDYRISNTLGARIYGDGTLGTSGTNKGKKNFTTDNVSWTFTTQNKKDSGKNQSGDQWMVDALEINGTTIEIPYANPGDSLPVSKTTTLPSGTVITVSLTNIVNQSDNYTGATRTNYRRTYTITATNCYEDLVITGGNIVDIDVSTEIIAEVLENVTYAFNGYSTSDRAYSGTGLEWQTWGVGEPIAVGTNQSVSGGRNWNMYGFNQTNNNAMRFQIPTGYYNPEIAFVSTTGTDLIGNVQLGNGLSRGAKTNDYYPITGNPTGGYYYFRITDYTANNNNVALLRIRASLMRYGVSYAKGTIPVDATIPEYDYGGYYGDGTLQGYNVEDNTYVVINKSAPTAEGYVFQYYTIDGAPSTQHYAPSQKVPLEDVAQYGVYDASKQEYVIPLVAHWEKKTEESPINVTAHVILDDVPLHDYTTVVPKGSSIYIDIDSETMTEIMNDYNWQLFYDETGSSPFIEDVDETNNEVTLHLYSKFYVYHSSTGVLELHTTKECEVNNNGTLSIGKLDITKYTNSGSLYGGYYMDYQGAHEGNTASGTNLVKAAADYNNNYGTLTTSEIQALSNKSGVVIDTVGTPYSPNTTAAHVGWWNISNAFTAALTIPDTTWYSDRGSKDTAVLQSGGKGTEVTVARAGIYYLKEVPAESYLRNYHQIIYNKTSLELTGLYLFTAIDDTNYNENGFTLKSTDGKTATVVKTFTITNASGKSVVLKPTTIFKNNELTGDGYLGYWDVTGSSYYATGSFTILPYWETPDTIKVDGISTRKVTISSMTKSGVTKTDE
ncbi:MAG: hypothetical protein IKE36_08515 [Solobacterium sp.]|nr:hypothetical protein [Solobacterium sp.]